MDHSRRSFAKRSSRNTDSGFFQTPIPLFVEWRTTRHSRHKPPTQRIHIIIIINNFIFLDSVHVLMEEVDVSPYSPACLSHAALVYFGSDTVGWRAVHQSWIDSCYSKWDAHLVRLLSSQCEHIIEPTLKFLDSRSSGGSGGALQHVTALSNFLASLLEKNQHQLRGSRFQLTNDHIVRLLSSLFGLAYIWAFGSCLDENDFASFDAFAREQLSLCPIPVTIPDEGTVFDYWIDVSSEGDCQFVAWPDRSTTKSSILSIPKVK